MADSQLTGVFQFLHACGMMTYSEIFLRQAVSFCESGTRITYDSKLSNVEKPNTVNPNLTNLEVEDCTSAHDLGST